MTEPPAPQPPPPAAAPPPATPAYGAPQPPRGGFPTWGIIAIIAAIVLVGGGVAALVLLGGDDEPEVVAPVETTAIPTPAPTAASPVPVETPASPVITSPETTACTSAPPATLINCVPEKVGQYTLTEWDNAPQFAQTFNANNAIEVTFQRGDGSTLSHFLFSYNTHTEATIEKDNYVSGFEATGYTVVGTTRERGINATRLAGPSEVLVWSNGNLMGTVVGPFDVTTGFFLELPY